MGLPLGGGGTVFGKTIFTFNMYLRVSLTPTASEQSSYLEFDFQAPVSKSTYIVCILLVLQHRIKGWTGRAGLVQ